MNRLVGVVVFVLTSLAGFAQSEKEEFARLKQENMLLQDQARKIMAIAEIAEKNAQRLRYQAIAHALGEVSVKIKNKELAGLLALQALRFSETHGGYAYEEAIYTGLFEALKRFSIFPKEYTSKSSDQFSEASPQSHDQFHVSPEPNGDIIISTKSGASDVRLAAHNSKVDIIRFSNSGNFMLTGDADGLICIWNLKDQTKRPISIKESTAISDVTFSKNDSQLLIKLDKSRSVHIWTLNAREMAQQLEEVLSRNLTKDEWVIYVAPDLTYEKTVAALPEGR